eukprot:m.46303 g.46303  ORF g.46303 m.46303 type:complete len:681 (-) comp8736_c0_seq2:143-2185(-)
MLCCKTCLTQKRKESRLVPVMLMEDETVDPHERKALDAVNPHPDQLIRLNVGGTLFLAAAPTFSSPLCPPRSLLAKIGANSAWRPLTLIDGAVFLNRDGAVFGLLLRTLIAGGIPAGFDFEQCAAVRGEASFWGLPCLPRAGSHAPEPNGRLELTQPELDRCLSRQSLQVAHGPNSEHLGTRRLEDLNLNNLQFREGVHSPGCHFTRCTFKRAQFVRAPLSGCVFTACDFSLANFGGNLELVVVRESTFDQASIDGGTLEAWKFEQCDMRLVQVREGLATTLSAFGCNLSGIDLAKWVAVENVTSLDLRECNLNGADFSAVKCAKVALQGATLRGATLSALAATWEFEGADLTGVDLTVVRWGNVAANFRNTILHRVKLPKYITLWNFFGADLTGVDFSDVAKDLKLPEFNWYATAPARVYLENSILNEAVLCPAARDWVFKGATLATATLPEDISNWSFRDCNLEGIDLTDCLGRNVDFTNARLCGARLPSDVKTWCFVSAILTNVDLSGCRLPTKLDGAVLTGARLPCNIMASSLLAAELAGADTSLLRDWLATDTRIRCVELMTKNQVLGEHLIARNQMDPDLLGPEQRYVHRGVNVAMFVQQAVRRGRLRRSPWTMARHRSFPPKTKPWVVNVFLCAQRIVSRQGQLPSLPLEMWVHILGFLDEISMLGAKFTNFW